MVSNPLLKSIATVTLFWYVLLLALSRVLPPFWPHEIIRSLYFPLLGALAGGAFTFAALAIKRAAIVEQLKPSEHRGMTLTLGAFPTGRKALPRTSASQFSGHSELANWLNGYRKKHPDHAALLMAVYQTLDKHRDIPASHIPGGHAGLNVLQHSINVMGAALELAPGFVYEGHRTQSGRMAFPKINANYVFPASDPLIPIATLAHDIGKLTTFKPEKNGTVKILKADHDTEGGRLLLTFSEFWKLSKQDRTALTMAVTFRHHISGIPDWVDDRPRGLVELTAKADITASQREGDGSVGTRYFQMPETTEDRAAITVEGLGVLRTIVEDAERAARAVQGATAQVAAAAQTAAASGQATPGATSPAAPAAQETLKAEAAHYITALSDLLGLPGTVNKSRTAVAYRHGEWLYVSDAKARDAIANRLNEAAVKMQPRGQIHPVTVMWLDYFIKRGALMNKFNGAEFSAKRALFNVRFIDRDGKELAVWSHTIVVKVSEFPLLESVKSIVQAPEIVKPAWGEASAINKKGEAAEPEGDQENLTANDSDASPEIATDETAESAPSTAELTGTEEEHAPLEDEPAAPPSPASGDVVVPTQAFDEGAVSTLMFEIDGGMIDCTIERKEREGQPTLILFPADYIRKRFIVEDIKKDDGSIGPLCPEGVIHAWVQANKAFYFAIEER